MDLVVLVGIIRSFKFAFITQSKPIILQKFVPGLFGKLFLVFIVLFALLKVCQADNAFSISFSGNMLESRILRMQPDTSLIF